MAYRMGKQPMANPNLGITTAAPNTMGQRINAEHLRQKPNPFGIAYVDNSYGALASEYGGCGGGCAKKSHSSSITKHDLILLMLAFGLGYLLVKR
tara:strand:- start:163 stop:447 length:285 start_codon:yes stop_codon:yes gene_type:complete